MTSNARAISATNKMAQRKHLTPEQQEQKRELTNARQRGVNRALRREKEYILQGMGTRDWTPEQQESILAGRVPEGYERHHMKCVSQYPEFADNPDNIQFLTEEEHIKGAHEGAYHNATNGYYNPETGEMELFNEDDLRPVQPRKLTSPIITQKEGQDEESGSFKPAGDTEKETGEKTVPKDNFRKNIPVESPSQKTGNQNVDNDNEEGSNKRGHQENLWKKPPAGVKSSKEDTPAPKADPKDLYLRNNEATGTTDSKEKGNSSTHTAESAATEGSNPNLRADPRSTYLRDGGKKNSTNNDDNKDTNNEKSDNLNKGTDNEKPDDLNKGSNSEKPDDLNKGQTSEKPDDLNTGQTSEKPDDLNKGTNNEKSDNLNKGTDNEKPDGLNKGSNSEKPDDLNKGSNSEKPDDLNKGLSKDDIHR